MVHGQKNGFGWLSPITQLFDWTDGCIALSNADMETVWQAVDVGTPIEIHP
jgi:murein L,D-transpeptidase YafK